MPISSDLFFTAAAVLLIFSVMASKFSDRFGIPALLIFLGIGMLAGSDGPGGIYFDDAALAQYIGLLALVIILFSGGLDTNWDGIRPVIGKGLLLATLGVLLTALVLGIAAHLIFRISILEGMLLGAIVSSTDAAAVFAILRTRAIDLKGEVKPLLEFEAGSNDPMAVFLTLGIIQLLQTPSLSPLSLIPDFFQQMLIGTVTGYAAGKLLLFLINRLRLGYQGLYPVLAFGGILLTYSTTNLLAGSGFLAVYVAGVVMGREEFLHKHGLLRFYDGLAWLMQIVMFLTLGLLVFPSRLVPIALPALALALILLLVARPLSVFVIYLFSRLSVREKAFISWVGLRGAVPIILAIYPRLYGVQQSDLIFDVVFFVVLTSMLIQGTSIPFVARWLKVQAPYQPKPEFPFEYIPNGTWEAVLRQVEIPENSWMVGKAIFEVGLPAEYLVVLISRRNRFIIPNGSVVLEANDKLLGLADRETHQEVFERMEREPVE